MKDFSLLIYFPNALFNHPAYKRAAMRQDGEARNTARLKSINEDFGTNFEDIESADLFIKQENERINNLIRSTR